MIINKGTKINPMADGVEFINIWINGKTELGQYLSHFYKSPFIHPVLGPFNSMEGFWHYIRNGAKDDSLRTLSGMAAKNHGKRLECQYVANFQEIITAANFYKIEQNLMIKNLLVESDLPFMHYYLFTPVKADHSTVEPIVINISNNAWLIDSFEEIRKMFQHGQRPKDIDYSTLK
jgi:hypothetical protein